jgi:hypothetical protein
MEDRLKSYAHILEMLRPTLKLRKCEAELSVEHEFYHKCLKH